jgi:large subunit ribosomal protein L18Ae
VQIIKTTELEAKDCRRDQVVQFHNSKISFPLTHRVYRAPSKALKGSIFKASRPNTMA